MFSYYPKNNSFFYIYFQNPINLNSLCQKIDEYKDKYLVKKILYLIIILFKKLMRNKHLLVVFLILGIH